MNVMADYWQKAAALLMLGGTSIEERCSSKPHPGQNAAMPRRK
jgi:hypothetical protein